MDVSAPRSTQVLATPPPIAEQTSVPATKPNQEPIPSQAVPQTLVAEAPVAQQPKSGAPVGVITVAVLMMMLLSAAAVIVYATSQTA